MLPLIVVVKLKVLYNRGRFALLDIKMCYKCPQSVHLLTTEKINKWNRMPKHPNACKTLELENDDLSCEK